jgi:hypothetical protein
LPTELENQETFQSSLFSWQYTWLECFSFL